MKPSFYIVAFLRHYDNEPYCALFFMAARVIVSSSFFRKVGRRRGRDSDNDRSGLPSSAPFIRENEKKAVI